MAGDEFRKVRSGERLQIPAAAWNAFLDATRFFREHQHHRAQGAGSDLRSGSIVKVKNASGADRKRFEILGIDAPTILPSDALAEFTNAVAVDGVMPTEAHLGKFVILCEPLKAGAIGRGVIAGVSLVRLDVAQSQLYSCAEIIADRADALQNVPAGSARVLWIESSGESQRWAIVRLDNTDHEAHVLITSNIPDENGYYNGEVQKYDIASRTWQTLYPCKVLDINA